MVRAVLSGFETERPKSSGLLVSPSYALAVRQLGREVGATLATDIAGSRSGRKVNAGATEGVVPKPYYAQDPLDRGGQVGAAPMGLIAALAATRKVAPVERRG